MILVVSVTSHIVSTSTMTQYLIFRMVTSGRRNLERFFEISNYIVDMFDSYGHLHQTSH
jgi:hypothetical protein